MVWFLLVGFFGFFWLVSSLSWGESEGLEDSRRLHAGPGCGLVFTLGCFPSKKEVDSASKWEKELIFRQHKA